MYDLFSLKSEEEVKQMPRNTTLPSISEDEEGSDSDNVFTEKAKSVSPTTSPKSQGKETSPLLNDRKEFSYPLPNGDVPHSPRYSLNYSVYYVPVPLPC